MLSTLRIKNLALVEDLTWDLGQALDRVARTTGRVGVQA